MKLFMTIIFLEQSILKSFPFEAKIPINFELLEENQAKILLKNSQKNVLQNAFNDEKLHELIFKIMSSEVLPGFFVKSESRINRK